MKLKIHLVSDLHEDVWQYFRGISPVEVIPANLGDVLVVAGDMCEPWFTNQTDGRVLELFKILRTKAKHVVFITGNHDYYKAEFAKTEALLKDACEKSGVHWLEQNIVELEGRRFIGATLWYDPHSREVRKQGRDWSDYCILDFDKAIPIAHRMGLDFLRTQMQKGDVVVTHMLPSWASVAPQFIGADTNCFFVTNVTDTIIKPIQPALWLHGHTHTPCEHVVHRTRVVCAPLGTPPEHANITLQALRDRLSHVIEI